MLPEAVAVFGRKGSRYGFQRFQGEEHSGQNTNVLMSGGKDNTNSKAAWKTRTQQSSKGKTKQITKLSSKNNRIQAFVISVLFQTIKSLLTVG